MTTLLVAIVLASGAGGRARGQEPTSVEGEARTPAVVVDAFDRGSPRGTVMGYLVACRQGDFQRAAAYLKLPAGTDNGPELARKLKVALDRTLWIDPESLSAEPQGAAGDGLLPDRDLVGTIDTKRGPVRLLVERLPRADGVEVWQFSASTVAAIPTLWAELGHGRLGEWLPTFFFDARFLEIQLWQWLGLLLLAAAALGLSYLLAAFALRLFRFMVRRTASRLDDRLLVSARGPLRLLLFALLIVAALPLLDLAVPAARFLAGTGKLLVAVAVSWFAFGLIDVAGEILRERAESRGPAVAALLPTARKITKVVVAALILLAVMQNLGVNISALLAGLGVGGIAVALAAQKTIENLFGGFTLLVDQPVRVGDFCRFGDQVGTVEDIGLRSIRIRTLDRTLISLPNAQFSSMQLENFAARDRIRLLFTLGLRYETSPDQLRWLLTELRRLLIAHPALDEPARARLVGFGAYSIDIEIFSYVKTDDWNEFLAVREDVLLRIMEVVAASGTDFAFPSQTTYLEHGAGVDRGKGEAVEQQVAEWRSRGQLPFPDLWLGEVERLEGTLDYPPRGSVAAAAAGA
jgi:MscS family membrane protein